LSKRDDDSQADMEVGMTTAERRRRRRRGGGLRVPSDNVPRRSTTPPVVAPVPEDPSLAMSIAYSFNSDASEPVPRVPADQGPTQVIPTFGDPIAPDAVQTVIDPPSGPIEAADFEMKTREMSSVDLEALGLTEPGTARASQPRMARVQTDPSPMRSVEVDVDMGGLDGGPTLDSDPSPEPGTRVMGAVRAATEPTLDQPAPPPPPPSLPRAQRAATDPGDQPPLPPMPMRAQRAATDPGDQPPLPPMPTRAQRVATEPGDQPPPPPRVQTRERLRTMALSDEDLEEVREAYRAATGQPPAAVTGQAAPAPAPQPTPGLAPAAPSISTTQPLTALDVEIEVKPESLAEIDINELAERADSSGEFEVDVEDVPLKKVPQAAAVTPPPPSPTADRKRPPSVPPPFSSTQTKQDGHPASVPPPFKPDAASTQAPAGSAQAHGAPPPPPPAAKHAPPTPPKVKPPSTSPSSMASKIEGKGSRGKPWFVDLFDEDYLRTLPFLTPQATQSEAEFVIEAMGLQPGAQVLDIGCGYGRHAMELAARGFHVVGLDLSTPLLVRGGEEAMRRGLEINFVRGDMRELDFDAQFDGAYCMFSTFGYFDDETNKKTVSNIARALKPGGRVMLEILNRDYVIADLPTRVWWEGEGCVVLEEVELNYFSSRIQVNRSVVFDDGRQLEQEISVRAYSLHEVGKLMHAAGFRVLEVSGGYHTRGRFFGNQSRHIIVLAERKDPSAT
jgi:SAM-dependent methyltransferase